MTSRRFPAVCAAATVLVTASACHRQATVTSPAPAPPAARPNPVLSSGDALVRAMHDRYAGKWYRTMSFTQKTTLGLASGGELVQTWYEAGMMPGRLRIDTDLKSKSGQLFARDSVYVFTNGRLSS